MKINKNELRVSLRKFYSEKYDLSLPEDFDRHTDLVFERIENKLGFYFRNIIYEIKAIISPIKVLKNMWIHFLNFIDRQISNDALDTNFLIDVADLTRKIEVGEINEPEEYERQYNEILKKYGYREYEIY